MKKILLLLIFVTNISFSQNKNFTIEDKLIIWKLVYEDSTNISELKNNPRLEFITDSSGYIKKQISMIKKLDN